MLDPLAEHRFRDGLDALRHGRRIEALACFEAAVELDRRRTGSRTIQPRYLSYYGLCLTRDRNRAGEGVRFCREATQRESYDADLFLNLGEAYLSAGRRREAHGAFRKGLRIQPDHPGIERAMKRMGRRRRPAIPFLSRSNPLNVLLGKWFRRPHGGNHRAVELA